MQKIISLFQRNYETDRLVRNEIVPGAEWVINGEGIATRKLDGTSCLINQGVLFKRYDLPLLKEWANKKKFQNYKGPWTREMYVPTPKDFILAQDAPDESSGHWPGWLVVGLGPEDKYHREAFNNLCQVTEGNAAGTYELVGPKIQNNPEHYHQNTLVKHGSEMISDVPRDFEGIRDWFVGRDIEGIVWHHPDGRMVKIKKKDFGMKR